MTEQNNTTFPEGMMIKPPRQGAPDFVKGSISIKRLEFIQWLNTKPDEWVNLDIKISKANKMYLSVNDWKPNQQGRGFSNNSQQPQQQAPSGFDSIDTSFDNPNSGSVPF